LSSAARPSEQTEDNPEARGEAGFRDLASNLTALVHRVIASKQEMTDRDDVVEEAGGQEEEDDKGQRGDDQPMMSFDRQGHSCHDYHLCQDDGGDSASVAVEDRRQEGGSPAQPRSANGSGPRTLDQADSPPDLVKARKSIGRKRTMGHVARLSRYNLSLAPDS
jgi:hypothetical protein